jgi:hypothetical protein
MIVEVIALVRRDDPTCRLSGRGHGHGHGIQHCWHHILLRSACNLKPLHGFRHPRGIPVGSKVTETPHSLLPAVANTFKAVNHELAHIVVESVYTDDDALISGFRYLIAAGLLMNPTGVDSRDETALGLDLAEE